MGAAGATLVFLLIPVAMRMVSGHGLAVAELRQLLGTAIRAWPGYLLFGVVVFVVASLCMLTSRFGVYRILRSHD